MKVSDILRVKGNTLYTVAPDEPLAQAIDTMAEKDIGSLVVMEHGDLVGMLTFREVIQCITANKHVVGDTIVQANPDQDAKVRRAMDELFLPELSARLPAFMDEIAILYTTHFTLKELRQLNAFYASPVGKKSVNAMPQIAQQSMQIGSVWGQRAAQDVLQKLAPQLRQRGIKNL